MVNFEISESAFNKYSIYLLAFPSMEAYIGATGRRPETRWANGKGYQCGIVKKRIEQFGWDKVYKRVLMRNLTIETARHLEKYAIQKVAESPFILLNTTDGGDGLHYEKETDKNKKVGKIKEAIITQETINEIMAKKYRTAQPIYCVETGEIYSSIAEASRILGIGKGTLNNCCCGHIGSVYGLHYRYLSEYGTPFICRKNKSQTKVRCVETNAIFNSMKEAADLTGIHISNISRACNKQCEKAGGYTWEYVDRCKRQGAKQHKKAVRCIDTGIVYPSALDAVNALFPDKTLTQKGSAELSIRKVCGNAKNRYSALDYKWEFVDHPKSLFLLPKKKFKLRKSQQFLYGVISYENGKQIITLFYRRKDAYMFCQKEHTINNQAKIKAYEIINDTTKDLITIYKFITNPNGEYAIEPLILEEKIYVDLSKPLALRKERRK